MLLGNLKKWWIQAKEERKNQMTEEVWSVNGGVDQRSLHMLRWEEDVSRAMAEVVGKMRSGTVIHFAAVNANKYDGLITPLCYGAKKYKPGNWTLTRIFDQHSKTIFKRQNEYKYESQQEWINKPVGCHNCFTKVKKFYDEFHKEHEQREKEVEEKFGKYAVNVSKEFPVIIRRTFAGGKRFMHYGTIRLGVAINELGEPRDIRFSMGGVITISGVKEFRAKIEQYYSFSEIRDIFGISFSDHFIRRCRSACAAQNVWFNIRAFKEI